MDPAPKPERQWYESITTYGVFADIWTCQTIPDLGDAGNEQALTAFKAWYEAKGYGQANDLAAVPANLLDSFKKDADFAWSKRATWAQQIVQFQEVSQPQEVAPPRTDWSDWDSSPAFYEYAQEPEPWVFQELSGTSVPVFSWEPIARPVCALFTHEDPTQDPGVVGAMSWLAEENSEAHAMLATLKVNMEASNASVENLSQENSERDEALRDLKENLKKAFEVCSNLTAFIRDQQWTSSDNVPLRVDSIKMSSKKNLRFSFQDWEELRDWLVERLTLMTQVAQAAAT